MNALSTASIEPTPRASRFRPNRERILATIRDAAIEEFSVHGFRGASTQAIAQRAGLTKQQLHYYIKSKNRLYEELLYAVLDGWSSAFNFQADAQPGEVLAGYVQRKVHYALDNPGLSRIFTSELLAGGPNLGRYWPVALQSTAAKVAVIEGWVQRGLVRPLDARLLLMHIWAMTQHYADYGLQVRVMLGVGPEAVLDREPIVRELTSLVLHGCGLATAHRP